MLGGDSTVLANAVPPAAGEDEIGGGGGANSGEDGGDRASYGGNRWPRQETLALLKIRSDMDAVFRDSSVKGPLWEEVSRKLADLGFHRNAKKCKEKFENVYKYHRRTKEGRTGKSEGKTYKFFDQMEAFGIGNSPQPPHQPPQPPPQKPELAATPATTTLPWTNPPTISHATLPATTNHHHTIPDPTIDSPNPLSSSQPLNPYQNLVFPASFQNLSSHLFSSSTSSSTASDEEMQGGSRKRKRKWKGFFERLTKDVIKKQEDLQRRFLETVEKREQERIAREESWRMQETARINREHETLIQERAAASAKDAALIAVLQKISGQQIPLQTINIPPPAPLPPPLSAPVKSPVPVLTPEIPSPVTHPRPMATNLATNLATNANVVAKKDNGETNNAIVASPSRWPKVEVEALIRLRTNLDIKYQDNGPKGPLWEEISSEMKKIGYNRSSKRCKEKWENINKYFKKVKESSKKRPEDSKTCPYFHQLNALYMEKSKNSDGNNNSVDVISSNEPLMVRPEQQWPLQQGSHPLELNGRENMEEDEEEDEMDTEEEEGGGGEFQVVASKPIANTLGNGK